MCVDHRGIEVGVTEQFLNGADILAVLEEMSCKTMSKRVATYFLWDIGLNDGATNRFLDGAFMAMMSSDSFLG